MAACGITGQAEVSRELISWQSWKLCCLGKSMTVCEKILELCQCQTSTFWVLELLKFINVDTTVITLNMPAYKELLWPFLNGPFYHQEFTNCTLCNWIQKLHSAPLQKYQVHLKFYFACFYFSWYKSKGLKFLQKRWDVPIAALKVGIERGSEEIC